MHSRLLEHLDLTDRIGRTPLIVIGGLAGVPDEVTVLGKAEWFNPGGSVKDRAAWGMVREAEARGFLPAPGTSRRRGDPQPRTILDATSGNTGIALAWIGAARGYEVRLCVPANANAERKRLLAALGAEVTYTDPLDGTDGAIREARRLAAEAPDRYLYLDQYANDANWRAHVEGTAGEIWRDTEGRVTHFVAGLGTTGTLVGTSRGLREHARRAGRPAPEIVAVEPDSPYHALEGLKHLPTAIVPPIYDATAHDRLLEVASDEAIDLVKRQARRGLMLGWSAGAALVGAAQIARTLTSGLVVAVLPDGAERYLSEPLWQEG
jgi:cysteine synthase B